MQARTKPNNGLRLGILVLVTIAVLITTTILLPHLSDMSISSRSSQSASLASDVSAVITTNGQNLDLEGLMNLLAEYKDVEVVAGAKHGNMRVFILHHGDRCKIYGELNINGLHFGLPQHDNYGPECELRDIKSFLQSVEDLINREFDLNPEQLKKAMEIYRVMKNFIHSGVVR